MYTELILIWNVVRILYHGTFEYKFTDIWKNKDIYKGRKWIIDNYGENPAINVLRRFCIKFNISRKRQNDLNGRMFIVQSSASQISIWLTSADLE